MKQKKRVVGIAMIMTILILSLSGCGVTKASLLTNIGKNMLVAKSLTMKAAIDSTLTGEVMGATVDAKVSANMDTDVNLNPFVGHGKGAMSFEVLGQSQTVNAEVYEEVVDNRLNVFASADGTTWHTRSSQLDDSNFKFYGIAGIAKLGDMLELEDKTEMLDGEECYVLTGEIDGQTLEQVIKLVMGDEGQMKELLKDVDWSGRQAPTKIYVSKKNKHLVKLSFDIIGVMDAAMESALGPFSGMLKCSECTLDITFSNYNKVEPIVIPDDVRNNAEKG